MRALSRNERPASWRATSCPPTANPCFYGIDFAEKSELIAANHSLDEIRQFIEADSLGYLSVEGLLSPFEKPDDFCTACFTAKYPIDPGMTRDKHAFENGELQLKNG